MKKLVVIFNLAFVLLSSCVTQKKGTSTYNDDVYANPKEDRIEDARIAAEKKQAKEASDKRYNDSIAAVKKAQKDKDDANPYYKDKEFKYDDYYDYEYATRVKRFNNNINGLSYYDNYYTNSYWYNQNPYNYGVSVYNGYSWWGPSYNSYSYNPSINFYSNWGWGCNSGYGYSGYNPYMAGYMQGYNNGFNNGYFGNPYGYGSPYGYGGSFGFGYGNYGYGNYGYGNPYGYGGYGYNNGWGYYNSYDNNSSYTYGPRSSHGGGNSRRTSNPGTGEKRESYSDKYVKDIAEQQIRTDKFTEIKPPRSSSLNEPIRVNNTGTPIGTGGVKQPHTNTNSGNEPVRSNTPIRTEEPIRTFPIRTEEPTRNNPIRTIDSSPVKDQPTRVNEPIRQNNPIRNAEPVKQQPIENTPRFETPVRQQTPSSPNINGGGSTPSNNGGGHRPR
ncbi:MAG: hypothetical protein KAZ71_01760 [Bacteroidia bacterium]|nr:hypothetical protein [Bacteroidia bacterium]